jgi:hypothetical protein
LVYLLNAETFKRLPMKKNILSDFAGDHMGMTLASPADLIDKK